MPFADFPPRGGEPVVVLEDPDFLAVRKPAGMHSSSGPAAKGGSTEETLLDWTAHFYPETAGLAGWGRGEGGLLHRLDRETSGLVLFARSDAAFQALSDAAARGAIRKEYVLLARPAPSGLSGCRPERGAPADMDAQAWMDALSSDSQSAVSRAAALLEEVRKEGRSATVESLFRAYGSGAARVACAAVHADLGKKKRLWGSSPYRTELLGAALDEVTSSLKIRATLRRGFRHQIRAHLAWIGLPLLGDAVYGGASADRLFLHAAALAFPHPGSGCLVSIEDGVTNLVKGASLR